MDLFTPSEQHRTLRDAVRTFSESFVAPQAAAHDRGEQFNRDLFRQVGELGWLGLTLPPSVGGMERDASAAVILYEELSAADAGFALSCLSHSILFAHHLASCGNAEQQQRFLPDACAGRIVAGMAMTESIGGTDVFGMQTTARREDDNYVLNGEKMWITNGVMNEGIMGDVFLVYARTSSHGPRGLSLFLIEKGRPGFFLGRAVEGRLGVRASKSAQLVFENCVIPLANRVGNEGCAIRSMVQTLAMERLTMAAMSLGIARRALEIMNHHATQRRSFGQPLREFGQIQRHIGESYAEWMAGRTLVYHTALGMKTDSSNATLNADAAKLYCATMAKTIADRAVQVLGAYGYSGETPVERLWRDAKLFEIGGGTLEAHQRNITRVLSRLEKLE